LEVIEDDRDERTSEEVDEVVVGADVSANKETVGAIEFGSGSLLGVENLSVIVRTELESSTGELNVATLGGHEEVLASADLVEFQLELLSSGVNASLGRTGGLDGEAVALLDGNLGTSLVDEVDLESPTFFTNVGLFAFDVHSHQLSFVLVDANTFVLGNEFPSTTSSTLLLRDVDLEVLFDDGNRYLRGSTKRRNTVFRGLNVKDLSLRGRGGWNFKGRFNLDSSRVIVELPLGEIGRI